MFDSSKSKQSNGDKPFETCSTKCESILNDNFYFKKGKFSSVTSFNLSKNQKRPTNTASLFL